MASGLPDRSPTIPIRACRTARTCGISGVPARPWRSTGQRMTPGRAAGKALSAKRQGQRVRPQGPHTLPYAPCAMRHALCAMRCRRGGFTLIELLIVITIIGILITLAQPSYNRAVTAAKEATLKENLFILRDTIDQFYADNGTYPLAL